MLHSEEGVFEGCVFQSCVCYRLEFVYFFGRLPGLLYKVFRRRSICVSTGHHFVLLRSRTVLRLWSRGPERHTRHPRKPLLQECRWYCRAHWHVSVCLSVCLPCFSPVFTLSLHLFWLSTCVLKWMAFTNSPPHNDSKYGRLFTLQMSKAPDLASKKYK